MSAIKPTADPGPILFYDGECDLCDRSVRWCLRHDKRGVLRYAPLQGETFARLNVAGKPRELETVVFYDEDGLHFRSRAVLRLLKRIGGGWAAMAALGGLIPLFFREAAYRFIARNRLAWFGGAEACQAPEPGHRNRFLP